VRARVVCERRRGSWRLGRALVGAVCVCLLFALAASARVGAGAPAGGARAKAAGAAAFPLSVRRISVRTLRGRILASATIVNTGSAAVRSTTGVLALSSSARGAPTGILTFSVRSLAPRGSSRVRLTTRPLRALPVRSGTYTVLICTDIDSQIRRFAQTTNCARGGRLAISTLSHRRASGPVPNTTIRTSIARLSRSSTAAFGFVSTVRRSSFQCSLDGAPWLACRTRLTCARSAPPAKRTRPPPTPHGPSIPSPRQSR